MSRIIITGTKSKEDRTIEILYKLNFLHIEDYHQEHEGFKLGKPLKQGEKISEDLIKIRSISKSLNIDDEALSPAKFSKIRSSQISQQIPRDILPLQKRILSIVERINALERRKVDRQNTIKLLQHLSAFPLPLELYSGFRTLETFVGTIKVDPRQDLNKIAKDYEIFYQPVERGEILIALFVSMKYSKAVLEFLNSKGFAPMDVPLLKGRVNDELARIHQQVKEIDEELGKLKSLQDDYKSKYMHAILAAEEHLANEVEKTDAPLRFASSKNAFIIDGWIPTSKLELVKLHLSSGITKGIYLEVIEEAEFVKDEEKEPPIQLENPQGAKPYEYLIELFSLPSYKEFDPTMVLYLIFPIFFGFMIGDAGYGVALMILAVIMAKVFPSNDARNIAQIVFVGGIFSIIFGILIFADAFGIPFNPHSADELSWAGMLGIEIPIHSALNKLGTQGVIEMLVLSIFAAFVHLGLGFIIGITNEAGHNNKHALAKAGWFIVLLAIFMLIINMAQNTLSGEWVGNYILFNSHLNAWEVFGLPLPHTTGVLLLIGIILLVVFEGGMAIMEILGLIGNMISYTRLAAIGVAKGAVAVAFNTMLLPLFVGGNIGAIIIGAVLLFICHMLVIILGAISSGIQAVRLNYVEFFLKFYKGGGMKFTPFGATKKHTL
jgi:V/A-type H+-transporting ATPase subunit I